MEPSAEKLIRDFKVVLKGAEDLIRNTSAESGDKTREARARLAGAVMVAKESCERVEHETKEAPEHRSQRSMVRDYPYESLGICFVFGVLVGLVVPRK